MIGVTCLAVWRAIAHNSLAIVIMAAIGGLTTPAWLSTGEMNTVGLFTYLSLLSVGLYALALWRDTWRPVAFITSLGLVTWWMSWFTIIGAGDDVIIGSVFSCLPWHWALGITIEELLPHQHWPVSNWCTPLSTMDSSFVSSQLLRMILSNGSSISFSAWQRSFRLYWCTCAHHISATLSFTVLLPLPESSRCR
ncbi:MAG: DUF2339 domain-containing protein [Ignavibacteria bacterium]|nr:DUF2339 domain-containing protein [Ignavibacteria bacterium]